MIVLFTGAGGTGKTTLASLVSERYDVPLLRSPAREVQRSFGVNHEDDQASLGPRALGILQAKITEGYWNAENKARADSKGYVSDRAVSDQLSYRILKGAADMTDAELDTYLERVEEQFVAADLVVHCPTGVFEPTPDGVRSEDFLQRSLFDIIDRGVIDLFRHKINVVSMSVGPVDVRVQHIHTALLNVYAVSPSDGREERLVREWKGLADS